MRRSTLEIVMGLVVLVGAAGFTALVYQLADLKTSNGYEVGADFGATGGLVVGDDVRLSGSGGTDCLANAGSRYLYTRINMQIDNNIKLPEDSLARITAASLLGGNSLRYYQAVRMSCQAGAVIYDTRDPVGLSDLGKFVQNNAWHARLVSGCLPLLRWRILFGAACLFFCL